MRMLTVLVCIIALLLSCGCGDKSVNTQEQNAVMAQQQVYVDSQPAPFFDYSLMRDLMTQLYVVQNSAVQTWSYITPLNSPYVLFEARTQGYPIPVDTQLTNPLQISRRGSYSESWEVIEQPEPNGLYTSKNSDGTILMAINEDGTLSPIYTEMKVTCFPFPVKWDREDHMWKRVTGKPPTVSLTPKLPAAEAE